MAKKLSDKAHAQAALKKAKAANAKHRARLKAKKPTKGKK